jgi:hypothetical protein
MERLRFKLSPKLADWSVRNSAAIARRKLSKSEPVRVLVDNSVLGNAVTHETQFISTGPNQWGTISVNTGYMARIPIHSISNTSAIYKSVSYLPGIIQLFRTGDLGLFTSAELQSEAWQQPAGRYGGYGCFDLDLFEGITLGSVDGLPPVQLSPRFVNGV